jgi:hypothetical protein
MPIMDFSIRIDRDALALKYAAPYGQPRAKRLHETAAGVALALAVKLAQLSGRVSDPDLRRL